MSELKLRPPKKRKTRARQEERFFGPKTALRMTARLANGCCNRSDFAVLMSWLKPRPTKILAMLRQRGKADPFQARIRGAKCAQPHSRKGGGTGFPSPGSGQAG